MKRKIVINYEWWMVTDEGNVAVPEKYKDFLVETADEHIKIQMAKGFSSGELSDNILAYADDPDDGVKFKGSWDASTTDEEM